VIDVPKMVKILVIILASTNQNFAGTNLDAAKCSFFTNASYFRTDLSQKIKSQRLLRQVTLHLKEKCLFKNGKFLKQVP
jgi:hypothetical protein